MVTVDLITGFLGAGKTTFIHKYIHFLKSRGLKIRIIENEFGEIGIDTQLLKEEDCEISDLAGLCMCCVGKEAFIRMLKESAESGCDRIVVEPSGIYDVDEFFEVLSLPEICSLCEIGSILTIADPMGMEGLSEESEYLMFAQLLASGMVLLSKTQLIDEQSMKEALERIDALMVRNGCEGGLRAEICTKPWDELEETDYEDFTEAGYMRMVHDRELFSHSEAFQSVCIKSRSADREALAHCIERVFESPACGRVYRIKGFARDSKGFWYEINCTPQILSIEKTTVSEGELTVIGQYLREKEIKAIWRQ